MRAGAAFFGAFWAVLGSLSGGCKRGRNAPQAALFPPPQCSPPPPPPVSGVCKAAVSALSGAPLAALPQKAATFSPLTAARHTAQCAVTAQPRKRPPPPSVGGVIDRMWCIQPALSPAPAVGRGWICFT